jgi:hypothetical protein
MTTHNSRLAGVRETENATAVVRRDEWLLDEAIMETFPASDPVAPYQHANDGQSIEPIVPSEGVLRSSA